MSKLAIKNEASNSKTPLMKEKESFIASSLVVGDFSKCLQIKLISKNWVKQESMTRVRQKSIDKSTFLK